MLMYYGNVVNLFLFLLYSCMWDLEAGKRTNEVEAAHCGDVVSLSLAPDQNMFVTGSVDKTCKLWDRRELKCKQVFFGHEADVNSVCVCIPVVYNTYNYVNGHN